MAWWGVRRWGEGGGRPGVAEDASRVVPNTVEGY
jgi:hypothetical protein